MQLRHSLEFLVQERQRPSHFVTNIMNIKPVNSGRIVCAFVPTTLGIQETESPENVRHRYNEG